MLPLQLDYSRLTAPSPLDEHPNFPNVLFRFEDDSPLLGFPNEHVGPIVAQVVPDSLNKYTVKFDGAVPIDWRSAWEFYHVLRASERSGRRVVVHPRVAGVEVVGISRGFSRFVIGAGISIYVKQVIGPVPDGVRFGAVVTRDMVAVRACTVPGIEGATLAYHLVPAEYVSDPPLPRFLRGYSPLELELYLPPPPVFSQACPYWEDVNFRFAKVQAGISYEEWRSGARIVADGGGVYFNGTVERGVFYQLLRGDAV